MSDDETFEVTESGASLCEKTDSNRLKAGSLVMIKGNPCKVTEVTTAKPGKHGSAKVILKGKDILTNKVYDCTFHAGDMVDAPLTKRTEYTLLSIDDEALYRTKNDIYPSRYGSWDDSIGLYNSKEVPIGGYDFIIIGTPPDSHIELARSAVKEGAKVVLVEKPLCAPNLQGAQELFDEANFSSDYYWFMP